MFSKSDYFAHRIKPVLFLILGAVLLSACTTTRDPRLVESLKSTRITEVRVEATPDVGTGLPMMNGITSQQQVDLILNALRTVASRNLKGYPGGPNASRLVITLQQADLASMPGRIVLGSDSWIVGTVRLEDIKTGRLVAQNPRIQGSDRGMRGSGLGVIAAVAVNAATSKNQGALAEKLATSFIRNVKAWLSPK